MGRSPSMHCGSEYIMSLKKKKIKYNDFSLSTDFVIKGSCDFKGTSSTRNHPAKFGGHKHYNSGGIMFLVRHVILQDADLAHVVTLWVGAHQNKLLLCQVGGHRRSGIGDIIFLVCYA